MGSDKVFTPQECLAMVLMEEKNIMLGSSAGEKVRNLFTQ